MLYSSSSKYNCLVFTIVYLSIDSVDTAYAVN